jgi:hypothetical protein
MKLAIQQAILLDENGDRITLEAWRRRYSRTMAARRMSEVQHRYLEKRRKRKVKWEALCAKYGRHPEAVRKMMLSGKSVRQALRFKQTRPAHHITHKPRKPPPPPAAVRGDLRSRYATRGITPDELLEIRQEYWRLDLSGGNDQ